MSGRQEAYVIFRAACVAGTAISIVILCLGLFLDLISPLFDAGAPVLFPAALALGLKGLPVWIGLIAAYGNAVHFYLRQHGYVRETHYIAATAIAIYSLFALASLWTSQDDGPFLLLAGGLPISVVLGVPVGTLFRRLTAEQPQPRRARAAVRISKGLA